LERRKCRIEFVDVLNGNGLKRDAQGLAGSLGPR